MPEPMSLPIDDLLSSAIAEIAACRDVPVSTYRLQFHAGFTFSDAAKIIPYLHALGITHIYASPILKARPGSTHGYDVVDHASLNPELGTAQEFDAYVSALKRHGMRQIVDIVPNHMGVGGNDNAWWNDCLENGPASPYSGYFDIAWRGSSLPELYDKVLLPVLGEPYGDALEQGKIQLRFDAGGLSVIYYDRRFPLAPATYASILSHRISELRARMSADDPALREYEALLGDESQGDLKCRLGGIAAKSATIRTFIDANVCLFNGSVADPRSFDLLDDLLNRQFYRLACWRTAPDEINYRRFFDINDLAALCVEREEVFEASHAFIFRLVAEGKIAGLRIDHPDGLLDPEQYFSRLQRRHGLAVAERIFRSDPRFAGTAWASVEQAVRDRLAERDREGVPALRRGLYVAAEKILAADESLPRDWRVDGTTGYDFINKLNGLFVDPAGESLFTDQYRELTGERRRFDRIGYEKKKLILHVALAGDLNILAQRLDRLAQKNRHWRDFTMAGITAGLGEVIANFPVYRTYVSDHVDAADVQWIEAAVRRAGEEDREAGDVLRFIRDVLLLNYPETFDESARAALRYFVGKFQQFTAPVTAKGIEDTAFYIYNRLASLNEVGGDPGRFGLPPAQLHAWLAARQSDWPMALSPLSTHDTKRSEDVRARLNVLSELPEEWWQRVRRWRRTNEPHRRAVEGKPAPDPNDEYLIYQTLVGTWPVQGEADRTFVERIQQYLRKAMREAKVHTRWTATNEDYENTVADFIAAILSPDKSSLFLQDFRAFQRLVSQFGLLNSLSQTLLRLTAPGVPDTYQGGELWDLSLVDPDNRRPVNYDARTQMLEAMIERCRAGTQAVGQFAREAIEKREDGCIKLFVTWRALTCRRDRQGLFAEGKFVPVEVEGPRRDHVFSFIRSKGKDVALVVIPRMMTRVCGAGELPVGRKIWGDTTLLLPEELGGLKLRDHFSGEVIAPAGAGKSRQSIDVADVFGSLPIALLTSE